MVIADRSQGKLKDSLHGVLISGFGIPLRQGLLAKNVVMICLKKFLSGQQFV